MKSKSAIYIVVAIIIVIGIIVYFGARSSTPVQAPVTVTTDQTPAVTPAATIPVQPSTPAVPAGSSAKKVLSGSTGVQTFTGSAIMLPTYYGQQISSTTLNIHVSAPASNTIVSTPITVTGEARGTWFFEASFPVLLTDASGRVIASGHAQAKSNWMTTDFVPFSSSFAFPKQSSGSHGYLILRKDNPSGLVKNDEAVEMAVTF